MAALSGEGKYLATIKKDQGEWRQVLSSLSELYTGGHEVNWKGFDKGYPKRKRLELPTYPFQRERYWIDREFKYIILNDAINDLLGKCVVESTND